MDRDGWTGRIERQTDNGMRKMTRYHAMSCTGVVQDIGVLKSIAGDVLPIQSMEASNIIYLLQRYCLVTLL